MNTEKRIFLTLAVLFFLLMHWAGWNETSRFTLTRAIVEEGRMETTSFARETGDRIKIGDKYYLDKAPGISLLAVPVHAFSVLVFSNERPPENKEILTDERKDGDVVLPTHLSPAERFSMIIATFLLSGLLTVLTAYLLFILSKEFIKDKRIQYLVPIGYALGTLAFSQALILQGHATSTFFAFAAFFVGYHTVKKDYFSVLKGGILAGTLAGIAFFVDYFSLFVVAGVGLWFLFSRNLKILLWYGAAFTAVVALILFYNFAVFGNPFTLSYAALMGEWGEVEINSLPEKAISVYFDRSFFDFRIMTVIRMLFMPERGIFFYFPFLLLAIPGMFFLFRKRPALAAIVLIIFFSLLWFLAMPYLPWWHGGSSFGPRQLTSIMPFLMIPIMFVMRKLHIAISAFLIAISMFINILGLQPPIGLEKELGSIKNIEEYHTAMASFTIIKNPLADYYWPRFIKNGINIPLVQNSLTGRPFDIRSNIIYIEDIIIHETY